MPARGADISKDECVTEKGQVCAGVRHGRSGQYRSCGHQAAVTRQPLLRSCQGGG